MGTLKTCDLTLKCKAGATFDAEQLRQMTITMRVGQNFYKTKNIDICPVCFIELNKASKIIRNRWTIMEKESDPATGKLKYNFRDSEEPKYT